MHQQLSVSVRLLQPTPGLLCILQLMRGDSLQDPALHHNLSRPVCLLQPTPGSLHAFAAHDLQLMTGDILQNMSAPQDAGMWLPPAAHSWQFLQDATLTNCDKASEVALCWHLQGSSSGSLQGRQVIMVRSTASNPQPGSDRGNRTPGGRDRPGQEARGGRDRDQEARWGGDRDQEARWGGDRGQEARGGRSAGGRHASQGRQLQVGLREPSHPVLIVASRLALGGVMGFMPSCLHSAMSGVLLLSCFRLRGPARLLPVLPVRALAAVGHIVVLRGGI